jgi:Holliday junction DNA helicase RuvA
MFEYIKGKLVELTPFYVIIETNNIGYRIEISLQTYTSITLSNKEDILLFLHQVIKEDSHVLYGFYTKLEREWFKNLISVNGIGANIARTILSAVNCDELQMYIQQAKVNELKNIKGIGQKTAERLIVELRNKVEKVESNKEIFVSLHNTIKEEALSALIMLGYNKNIAEKVINKILSENKNITTEELIKQALRQI